MDDKEEVEKEEAETWACIHLSIFMRTDVVL